ncbi:CDGSH iron-sulfur domain-containing protein [Nocardioides houyundeii]|uniref:CDGSH iron-sulfur domain-containing protein n=1 Tax=Nocardioides houyundeii TaxID=2045452 RepID=UPI000C76D9B7|nr:CDGSH iron-sulfur domain-containing protein [Nocardioides houyundeii]
MSAPAGPEGVAHPDVIICPRGPLLLRGDHLVDDGEGNIVRTERPVSAVCRCGKSETQPWCDGTHKVLPPKLQP